MKRKSFPDCHYGSLTEQEKLEACDVFEKFGFHWSEFGTPFNTPDLRFDWYEKQKRDCLAKDEKIVPYGCAGYSEKVKKYILEKFFF